ncbi:glycosyltransferase family 4 protein [Acidobacteriota bacterium]
MKIALITSMKYGLTQFIFRDVQALTSKGHIVRLFTLRNKPGLYNPLPEWDVIPVNRLRLGWRQLIYFLRSPIPYFRLLKDALWDGAVVDFLLAINFADEMKDSDVIFVQFGDHKFFTGYYCKKLMGIPLVVIIHAYELYRNPNPRMFMKALDYCDRIVTVSEHNKALLVDKYGADENKIEIVRLIVDLDAYKQTTKIKILIVGYFAEKKGHEILFRAIKKMARDDIEVWIVGDITPWVEPVDCRKLARDLDIESHVAFFGTQSDTALRALYRESDVFCLPSRKDRYGDSEGFPIVIAEAMAFSKPVVSTRHAGIPEVVDALLVDENDVDQLTAALNQACDSAELRHQLGEQNRKRAEQMFSSANNNRLEKILEDHALKRSNTS